jgi:hypothetical protein
MKIALECFVAKDIGEIDLASALAESKRSKQ